MQTFNRQMMETALDNMGQDPEDSIREDYSGRGMYGRTCFGLTLDNDRQLPMLAIELARQAHEIDQDTNEIEDMDSLLDQLTNLFDSMQSDSMGRGAIFYFPGWTLGNTDDEGAEEG